MKTFFDFLKKFWNKIKNSDFYKTYKEEIIVIPLLLVGFYIINSLLVMFFPNSAFFDFFSEIENIIFKIVSFAVSLWIAHLALRISFPLVYRSLHEYVYHMFITMSKDKQIEYAVKFILTFILASALIFSAGANNTTENRNNLLKNINEQLDVRETKPNRGHMVDIYLKSVKSQLGNPWCAAFVGYNLSLLNIKNPNSAYSPDYARPKDIIWQAKRNNNDIELLPGDVVTYYYKNLGRVGHVGFLEKIDNSGYFITIEGNTNGAGSREGDGVYKKKRNPNKVHAVSRYIL